MASFLSTQEMGVADCMASALLEVAEMLDKARDYSAFCAALRANHRVWLDLCSLVPVMHWQVPARMADFALAVSQRAGKQLSDQRWNC